MLATQVLVCLPIGCVEVLEVLRMSDAQVLVYLSIGLKCWKFCPCWPHRYLCACLSVGLKCWKFCSWKCCATHSMLYHLSDKLATQVLVCLPIGCVEVLEVLRMLVAQVLVYLSFGLKCWKFCGCWMHRYLCACLSVGLNCWKFCGCCMHRYLCTYRRMLAAQVLVCQSVGLKCWKFCWESVV